MYGSRDILITIETSFWLSLGCLIFGRMAPAIMIWWHRPFGVWVLTQFSLFVTPYPILNFLQGSSLPVETSCIIWVNIHKSSKSWPRIHQTQSMSITISHTVHMYKSGGSTLRLSRLSISNNVVNQLPLSRLHISGLISPSNERRR